MANSINNTNRRRKWLILGIGLLSATLSLFGYNYWKKHKQKTTPDSSAPDFKAEKPKTSPTKSKVTHPKQVVTKTATNPKTKNVNPALKTNASTKPSANTAQGKEKTQSGNFPIRQGAKNGFVRNLQQAIIKKYGKSILPKFGADGSFGNELAAAIRKIQKIPATSSVFISESFYNSLVKSKVLKGVDSSLIITTTATKVWKNPNTAVAVPVNMVLGQQVCQRGNFTLFENEKQYFLVETKAIKPYQPSETK